METFIELGIIECLSRILCKFENVKIVHSCLEAICNVLDFYEDNDFEIERILDKLENYSSNGTVAIDKIFDFEIHKN